jgi:hypothetical protein
VYFVAYGSRGSHAALANVLRQAVQDAGREALPVPSRQEAETYAISVLRRITGKSEGAQVLGAEILSDQKVQLWLFDSTTGQTAGQPTPLECPGCDRDALAQKVKAEATTLLRSCFGESCTKKLDVLRAPKEACEPMAAARCESGAQTAGMPSHSAGSVDESQAEISPRMARITKGALWGLFGAATVTSAGLLIANYTALGTSESNRSVVHNTLGLPSGIMGGMALLTLVVALPTTVVINRATMTRSQNALQKSASGRPDKAILQCPHAGAEKVR